MSNDLTQISLPTATGRRYWRSLDELAQTSEFRDWVDREFPTGASEVLDAASRRNMLKLMAASFGLAGLTACRRPVQHILPQSKGLEDRIPGKPYYYSSVFSLNGEAMGVLVETHDGRPTKIDGNPDHPYSQGAANALAHASLLNLYDPDRSTNVLNGAQKSTWSDFENHFKTNIAGTLGDGEGLRFLTPRLISPSYRAVKAAALSKYPKAIWVEFDPFAPEQSIEATKIAFGQPLTAHYAYDKAKVIVAISSDFLGVDSATVLPTRLFSKGRRVNGEDARLNRLYSIESAYSLTGANADHRLRLKPSEMTAFVSDLAAALSGSASPSSHTADTGSGTAYVDKRRKYLTAIAKDLLANKGASLVIGGPGLRPATQALIFGINQMLGNLGATVTLTKPVFDTENSGVAALKTLVAELNAQAVHTFVILGGNPAFTAPYDLHLTDAIKKAQSSVYLGPDVNETAAAAKWHIPEAHYLESWEDAQSADGTCAIQQPVIQPLYGGKTGAELAAYITGYPDRSGYDIVSNYWKAHGLDAKVAWEKALNDGVIGAERLPEVKVAADVAKATAAVAALPKSEAQLEVSFHPSFTVFDGSYANNAWAQELPDPMTKLVWGNAALLSPATARKLALSDGDLVNLKRGSFIVSTAVMIQPGHADDAISVILGYGRETVGRVGQGVGSNGYPLRTTGSYYLATDLTLEKVGGKAEALATTQNHHDMHGRPIVREATLAEYKKDPAFTEKAVEVPKLIQLYPDKAWDTGNQWGMTIDLTACTGCNACSIACQAENNIPVVGKDQVIRGREMHWIRIDRYYTGAPTDDPDQYSDDPQVVTQPVPCMQCENAPCENVCPVAATVHSPEGLNDMTYNRCVGTRYCMNNCPFKVRRFNFLNWHRDIEEIQKAVFNPDVTVRMRGVMEKCTYCVQRIQEAKIRYKTAGIRPQADGRIAFKDGDIQTACQQTCAADAIVFGDIRDPESRVSKLKKQERNYAMLAELNVRPRTTYLGKVRNPNTELEHA
jgi:MoCo/4Fe-4S cofactor protein with predicted Tat translocation signal